MRTRASILCGVLCALFDSASAQPQRVIDVPEQPSCTSCRIVVEPAMMLSGGGLAAELASMPMAVRRDGRGRYWILEWNRPPVLFDSAGRFIQVVGRRGQGPGEFRSPVDLVPLPGDSVLIVDDYGRTATVFDAMLAPARTVRVSNRQLLPEVVVFAWPGNVVMNAVQTGERGEPEPLVRYALGAARAEQLASFGSEAEGYNGPDGSVRRYRIAKSAAGHLWAADDALYRLSRWSPEGQRVQVLQRKTTWFPPPPSSALGAFTTPPAARIQALYEDDAGLLWVFMNVAAPTWREERARQSPRRGRGIGEASAGSLDESKLLRTRIEVLDPRSGRVLARRDVDEWVIAVVAGQRIAVYTVDRDDVPHIRIATFTLTGR